MRDFVLFFGGVVGSIWLYHYLIYCVVKFFVARRAKEALVVAKEKMDTARLKYLAIAAERQKEAEDALRGCEKILQTYQAAVARITAEWRNAKRLTEV